MTGARSGGSRTSSGTTDQDEHDPAPREDGEMDDDTDASEAQPLQDDPLSTKLLSVLEQLLDMQSRREKTALQDELVDRIGAHTQAVQAEALMEVLQQQQPAHARRREAMMDPAQAQLQLRFRAFHNALGFYGRRVSSDDIALLPSPRLHTDERLEFQQPLPPRGWTLVLQYDNAPEREIDIRRMGGDRLVVEDAGPVVAVRVEDMDRVPFLFGLPYRVPASSIRSKTRRS